MTTLEYFHTLDPASQWRVALYARAERTPARDASPLLRAALALEAPIRWQDASLLAEAIARFHINTNEQ